MHPAFSVIFFTTLSGAGYGLWFWTMVAIPLLDDQARHSGLALLVQLALGFVLVAVGLSSSVLHLGKPLRAWRAFSQWRSSWLSREGVLAMTTFVPLAYFAAASFSRVPFSNGPGGVAALWLAVGSIATVLCTAMIYASLRPIPAWSHRLVPAVYLVFALHTGALIALTIGLRTFAIGNEGAALLILLTSMLAWRLKRRYWQDIDRGVLPVTRNSALGLPADREIKLFERPHTEANYLTKEMGFVLARKHSRRLRLIAVLLFALVPALCALPLWFVPMAHPTPLLALACASALLGTFVERWLFFAEAKHVVMTYY